MELVVIVKSEPSYTLRRVMVGVEWVVVVFLGEEPSDDDKFSWRKRAGERLQPFRIRSRYSFWRRPRKLR